VKNDAIQHLRKIVTSARVFLRCAEKEIVPLPSGPDVRSRAQKMKDLDFCIASPCTNGHLNALRSSVDAAEKFLAELERLS
jgi:hypothetical protein